MKRSILMFFLICLVNVIFCQRVVLIEQFTNSGCPPCAAATPSVLNYVNTNPLDVVAISYHTSFPYSDSMYFENPTESNSRVSFYGVSGVPYSVVDGNYYSNSSSNFIPVISNTINARKAVAKKYDIKNVNSVISNNNLVTKIAFESLNAGNFNDTLRAQIVVIEKNVLKSSYVASPGANTETNYEYVMRKMLPTQNGSFLVNRALNGKDTITLNWNLQNIKNKAEIRVVAFVQNKTTKEIYGSNLFTTNLTTDLKETNKEELSFKVYPNPVGGILNIELGSLNAEAIKIQNALGKVLLEENNIGQSISFDIQHFAAGIYYVTLKQNGFLKTIKFVKE